jgi:DNA polymerase III subunit epsilon
MRRVILDTETTGLDPKSGHRVIEIGAIEMINRKMTENTFHEYLNPEREVEAEAIKVHGITNQFLSTKGKFADIADAFFDFIDGAELIIHNAPFDIGFLNHEFKLLGGKSRRIKDHCAVLDTLVMARKMHPGQRNNLDALCKRYHVDNTQRDLHGALLDSEILGRVYLAMTGGQASLFSDGVSDTQNATQGKSLDRKKRQHLKVLKATDAECQAHQAIIEKISDS